MVRTSILIKAFRHLCSFCDVYNKKLHKIGGNRHRIPIF